MRRRENAQALSFVAHCILINAIYDNDSKELGQRLNHKLTRLKFTHCGWSTSKPWHMVSGSELKKGDSSQVPI